MTSVQHESNPLPLGTMTRAAIGIALGAVLWWLWWVVGAVCPWCGSHTNPMVPVCRYCGNDKGKAPTARSTG